MVCGRGQGTYLKATESSLKTLTLNGNVSRLPLLGT